MPLSRSILRAIGWACIAAALLIAAVWIASVGFGVAYVWGNFRTIGVAAGWIEYNDLLTGAPPSVPRGWEFWVRDTGPMWRWDFLHVSNPAQIVLGIPLWPAPPALALLGALLLRLTRPLPFALCAVCGYDLRGLPPNTLCPECGTPAIPPPRDPAEPFLPVEPASGTNRPTPINSPPQPPPDHS